ncbi:MAG: lysostaphin resistance A-like protein, partial [Acidobacteriota bacterium]
GARFIAPAPFSMQNLFKSRALSGFELLLGSFIVIGHNVFRTVPNEVLLLFAVGLISIRFREGQLSAIGLKRPENWKRIILIAAAAAALRIVLGEYLIVPIGEKFWPNPVSVPDEAYKIIGNPGYALIAFVIVWIFAAFGEEFAYRGYLLTRAADLGKQSPVAYGFAVIFTSVLFGYGHYYKEPAGIIDSGIAGLILGFAYLLAGRNLWASILGHGFIDTFGIIVLFLGWDTPD